jgi:hypothetical protein
MKIGDMATRIENNGLGRLTLRRLIASTELDLVTVNGLAGPGHLAYPLRHDSVHGGADQPVVAAGAGGPAACTVTPGRHIDTGQCRRERFKLE